MTKYEIIGRSKWTKKSLYAQFRFQDGKWKTFVRRTDSRWEFVDVYDKLSDARMGARQYAQRKWNAAIRLTPKKVKKDEVRWMIK